MTKKDIVKTISDALELTQLQTKEIVQRTFSSIIDTLDRDGRIELRNFGVFKVRLREARRARNPRTGKEVFVGEKLVVTFKPGKEMEERILANPALLQRMREAKARRKEKAAGTGEAPKP